MSIKLIEDNPALEARMIGSSTDYNKYIATLCVLKGSPLRITEINGNSFYGCLDPDKLLYNGEYKLVASAQQGIHKVVEELNHGSSDLKHHDEYTGKLLNIQSIYRIKDVSIIPKI